MRKKKGYVVPILLIVCCLICISSMTLMYKEKLSDVSEPYTVIEESISSERLSHEYPKTAVSADGEKYVLEEPESIEDDSSITHKVVNSDTENMNNLETNIDVLSNLVEEAE